MLPVLDIVAVCHNMNVRNNPAPYASPRRSFALVALLLATIVCLLFVRSFSPEHVAFSNDGPLGGMVAEQNRLPAIFSGLWQDLNWLGMQFPAPSPTISTAFRLITSPLVFSKFYCPFALFILGLCAWFCFRQWKLAPVACVLGSLAAVLNSAFFSVAAWGVASQAITAGMMFLALGLLADSTSPRRWLRTVLAGMAVGMGVMEGYDIGAIYSLVIAAFVIYIALAADGRAGAKLGRGVGRLAVIGLFAAFMAAHTVIGLVSTQIQGVAGAEQDSRSRQERWDWATQWSLPKRETLAIMIPGLFGYRMDTPDGGNYWGASGRDPAWDRYFAGGQQGPPPQGFMRYAGGGAYAGVIVLLVALWSAAQAFRRKDSVFPMDQRKVIWFFAIAIIISLLLSWGRHAPFYQFLYALPYFSTIRNPAKFLHIFSFAVVILFAFGVHGLSRRYFDVPLTAAANWRVRLKSWWSRAHGFERGWIAGCIMAIVAALIGWLIYANAKPSVIEYLQTVGFDGTTARAIAAFSVKQVGWFIGLLVVSVALFALIFSGQFAGKRALWGGILLGALLVGDLARANLPWIIHWDYKEKYAINPVIDLLRKEPHQARVAALPFRTPPELELFDNLYRIEWTQHHFQYYNIQSLDIVQMPRPPVDLVAYEGALHFDGSPENLFRLTRRWQLTNTRYLLGAAGYLEVLNRQIDPVEQRFRIVTRFAIAPKPGVRNPTRLEELTAVPTPDGNFALFEFTGALPRAKLYANWQVSTNDHATLELLGGREFDPAQTVLVAGELPSPTDAAANQNAGTVEFASYAPKRIVLKAKADMPAVLLLNDRYDPNWQVFVNGKPAQLLRANYIMRAVHLPAGTHEVEFLFRAGTGPLYVSLAAIVLAIGLIGLLASHSRGGNDHESRRDPGKGKASTVGSR